MTCVPVHIVVKRCAGMDDWALTLGKPLSDLPPEGMSLVFSTTGHLLEISYHPEPLTLGQIWNAWAYFKYQLAEDNKP